MHLLWEMLPARGFEVYRVWLACILMPVVCAMIVCPALSNVVWHVRNGNSVSWREENIRLPLAWSASSPNMMARDELQLARKSWFVFASPALDTLSVVPTNSKMNIGLEDARFAMAQNGGPVSDFSRRMNGREFQCLSQAEVRPRISLSYLPMIHAYCQMQGAKWTLWYDGSPEILDEALGIIVQNPPR